ncbi:MULTISPECIES: outer membrane lipoprotein-sorting protein [unclassified Roseitalea]|uniref:outer membrane lipoprotein-sorting protein n=1 Tax=unclassified Roseitalea TaxID=2639107 RepID=UPI00273E661E|nr:MULTISPECIES: outer membrane lipoprotein-sorting protein [unclassified Roseitalea]
MINRAFLAVFFVLVIAATAFAQSAEQHGYELARRADAMTTGYGSLTASGEMVLRGGGTATRRFDFKSLEVGGGSRSLLRFEWPGDIRGTALLTHTKDGARDSQWVFLAANRRVKRISSSGRSGAFVGSEFAYEDMVDQELDSFTYKLVGTEVCCNIVERYPRFSSGYTKHVVWFDRNTNLPQRIDYYDRRNAWVKTMDISGYRNYGPAWRPRTMHMRNLLTDKSTTLTWSNYRFGAALRSGDFTTRALELTR